MPAEPNLKIVDELFYEYSRVMTIMYEKLRNVYNLYLQKFLTQEQRKELQLTFEGTANTAEVD